MAVVSEGFSHTTSSQECHVQNLARGVSLNKCMQKGWGWFRLVRIVDLDFDLYNGTRAYKKAKVAVNRPAYREARWERAVKVDYLPLAIPIEILSMQYNPPQTQY